MIKKEIKKEIQKIDDLIYYYYLDGAAISKARITERRALSIIWDVYTDAGQRRKGYAYELIKQMIEENENLFYLATICKENEASKRLFEKLGFKQVATGVNPKTGNTVLLYLKVNSI